jgi:hypothetical protein
MINASREKGENKGKRRKNNYNKHLKLLCAKQSILNPFEFEASLCKQSILNPL